MGPTQALLQVHSVGVPLFLDDHQFGGDALAALAEITGIPRDILADARWHMQRSGKLTALRRLLSDPLIPKAEGFSYLLTVSVTHSDVAHPKQRLGQTVTLQVQSKRGELRLTITTTLGRAKTRGGRVRHSARVGGTCAVKTPSTCRLFRHSLVVEKPAAWRRAAMGDRRLK